MRSTPDDGGGASKPGGRGSGGPSANCVAPVCAGIGAIGGVAPGIVSSGGGIAAVTGAAGDTPGIAAGVGITAGVGTATAGGIITAGGITTPTGGAGPPGGAATVRSGGSGSASTWMIRVSGRAKRSRWFWPQIGQKSKPFSTGDPHRAHFNPPMLLGLLRANA